MRKGALAVGIILVLVVAWCMNAYAADEVGSGWQGLWNSIGGFFYNALPWNWGKWMGQ